MKTPDHKTTDYKTQEQSSTLKIERVHCPNCGSHAERHHQLESKITRTQCGNCDYLLVMCSISGKVIEAYAPGLPMACSCR